VKEARNQSQINRKSISHNTTHRQSYQLTMRGVT